MNPSFVLSLRWGQRQNETKYNVELVDGVEEGVLASMLHRRMSSITSLLSSAILIWECFEFSLPLVHFSYC